MVILSSTSSRLTIVNHLLQSIAIGSQETVEVRLAMAALGQSSHLPANERRRVVQSARSTAAELAPLNTLSAKLRERVVARREKKTAEAAAIAAYRSESQRETQAK